jgi:hypothetical protein
LTPSGGWLWCIFACSYVDTRRKSQDFKYLDILTSIGLNLDLVSFRVAFLMRCKSSWLTEMQLAFMIECNNNVP